MLGRFIQADTIVPDPAEPQDLNRYSYVRNNPLKYIDPSGHQCSVNIETGEKDCFGDVTGLGLTLTVDWENGGAGLCRTQSECLAAQRDFFRTLGFCGLFAFGIVAIAEASPLLLLPQIGTATTEAACADGDCTNEISTLTQADLSAAQQFAQEAVEINSARGMQSFGSTWEWLSRSMLELNSQSRMFIARTGERITGMMQVKYGPQGYVIEKLEGIGGRAGTNLFTQAIQDSIAKGYGGSISLLPTSQAVDFYAQFPGYEILSDGMWYWSAEAAQAILGGH